MPYNSLREYIDRIESEGELTRVSEEVDWNLEIGAIMRKAADEYARCPAILFENIKGYPEEYSFFTGTVADYAKYALVLDLPKSVPVRGIIREYRERCKKLIKPKTVEDGPCKENIHKGKEVDLFEFPTPQWHQRDGGRFMGTFHCCITKDPDTRWVNVGLYRLQIHDKRTLGIRMERTSHAAEMYRKYEEKNKPMPIAISMGQDPINVLAAAHPAEAGVCEWDIAGGLRKAPVELVKCETIDLEVPATAEIIIEGEIPPRERREEGPMGEFTGYFGGVRMPQPFINVECITHRDNPIHTGLLEGKPIIEDQIMTSIHYSALLEKLLIDDLKLGVKAVYCPPSSASMGVCVSLKPQYPGHTKVVAEAILATRGAYQVVYIFIVDEDIDPTNLEDVLWAVCTRCKPDRDITVIPRERATWLWPALTPDEREKSIGCKAILEATFPAEWPKEWVPVVSDWPSWPVEIRQKVEKKWRAYGFKIEE